MQSHQSGGGALKRSIGLPGMVFYGVGTIIGGGFYALLGKIVGDAGVFAPLSLLAACAIALLNAFSFAELSRRYPVSAGEVQYVEAGFGRRRLAQVVGVLVILTGVISSATLCAATGGFLLDLTGISAVTLIALTALVLIGIASWGVDESVVVIAAVTLVEAGTLLVIILFSGDRLLALPEMIGSMALHWDQFSGSAFIATTFLAFYAFVGFEDMVNMAEEVQDVERTLPRAIFISMAITVFLYVGVAIAAIGLENRDALARAHTPLALLLPQWKYGDLTIGVISIMAGLNGALVQLIMASRVLYGMAGRGMAPRLFARVHPFTRTPLRATLLVGAVVLALSMSFPLSRLAEASSFVLLLVFALVSLALAALRWREGLAQGVARVPWLALLAAGSCLAMVVLRFIPF